MKQAILNTTVSLISNVMSAICVLGFCLLVLN